MVDDSYVVVDDSYVVIHDFQGPLVLLLSWVTDIYYRRC